MGRCLGVMKSVHTREGGRRRIGVRGDVKMENSEEDLAGYVRR